MASGLFILVFVAVAAAAVVGWVMSVKAAEKRQEALAEWATSHTWSFDPSDDETHGAEFPQFEVFQRGSGRAAYNSVRGVCQVGGRPFPMKCGDYRYTTSDGKTTTTHHFSYLILTLPFPNVPGIDIRRENLLDRVAGALGFQDINFESEEFSRKFFVKSPDRRFAFEVITPRMMEFLLASNPPPIHVSSGQVCLTGGEYPGCWEVPAFERHVEWAGQFFSLWPESLLTESHDPQASRG